MDCIDEENYISKEFKIKKGKDIYNLRIEIDQKYINLILKTLNNSFNYFYRNKVKITKLIDELQLDQKFKTDICLLLKIFENIYRENKIIIKIKDKNNINIEFDNSNNIKIEINLIKENLTIDEKLNLLYNEIRLRNYKNTNYSIENNIRFEYIKSNKTDKNSIIKEGKKDNNLNENIITKKDIGNKTNFEVIYRKI